MKRNFSSDHSGVYYLNNSGSRWIVVEHGKRVQIYLKVHGKIIKRAAIFFESFGNWASAYFKYKGKLHSTLDYILAPTDKDVPHYEFHSLGSHNL